MPQQLAGGLVETHIPSSVRPRAQPRVVPLDGAIDGASHKAPQLALDDLLLKSLWQWMPGTQRKREQNSQ